MKKNDRGSTENHWYGKDASWPHRFFIKGPKQSIDYFIILMYFTESGFSDREEFF